jgi:beta-glucosidase
VRSILETKLRFAEIGDPGRYNPDQIVCAEHVALAREAAQKSIVLLKNEPVIDSDSPLLPLNLAGLSSVAIIGQLATANNTGDHGSSETRPPYVVTPLKGIQDAIVPAGARVVYDSGKNLDSAADIARNSDVTILFAGYTDEDEGEYIKYLWIKKGGDRDSLCLHQHDEELIRTVTAVNPNTVVVLIGGSAIVTESWREHVPAILMAWYPGMEGGNAIADLLFGRVNPSGKLPCVFPKSSQQLPFFDKDADEIEYDYYHGYRLLDKNAEQPAFPFGFGMSYTTFEYSNLRIKLEHIDNSGILQCAVDVINTGSVMGDEIVQLYIGYEGSKVDRPCKELKGFARVKIEPGETHTVEFSIPVQQLAYFDDTSAKWLVEPMMYHVFIGPSSVEKELLKAPFTVTNIQP